MKARQAQLQNALQVLTEEPPDAFFWFELSGLGFRGWGFGFRVWGWGFGFRVWGWGCRAFAGVTSGSE